MEWKQRVQPEIYEEFISYGYRPLTATALCRAGIDDFAKAKEYLENEEILNPALIRNIGTATDVIWKHVYEGDLICVFGDYDADGITASAIMFLALRRLGAKVKVRLPDRIEEGYGISKKAILEQSELGSKLFITVDNGVRAIDETEYAKSLGCDVVILDHHEPGDELPKPDALIDLHIPGETYPYTELTGSGLAWKVAHFMLEQVGEHDYALSLADLAAIGTIGDVAPLHGENRAIVKRAIKQMRQPLYERVGVRALVRETAHITAEDIAFRVAPCLNAPGRLSSGGAALPLILLIEDDPRTAFQLARRVNEENERRKALQASCYGEIRAQAEQHIAQGEKVLIILSETAPSGIAGLLAGNLKEEFNRPAIVFCPKQDLSGNVNWTGSARSIDAFHMLNAIEQCSEYLLRYGGHKLAAGLTIESNLEKLDAFRKAMNSVAENMTEEDMSKKQFWDLDFSQDEIDDDLYLEMDALEPFGAEAPKPILRVRAKLNDDGYSYMGADSQHLKLHTDRFDMVGFSLAEKYIGMELPNEVVAYGNLSVNSYRGTCTKQISLVDFEPA